MYFKATYVDSASLRATKCVDITSIDMFLFHVKFGLSVPFTVIKYNMWITNLKMKHDFKDI